MAKRINPIPTNELPVEFRKLVRTFSIRGVNVAAYNAEMPTPSPEWIAYQVELFNNAKAAWGRLRTWKKSRWSLCALSTWAGSGLYKGISGYSGYTLYLKCWIEQQTAPDKQPISPCSARMTDPFASPWNYQP